MVGPQSKLQTALSGRFGKRFDSAVIFVVTAVKSNRRDAGRLGLFGNDQPQLSGCIAISASGHLFADALVTCAGTGQRSSRQIVNHLATEVFQ